MESFRDLFGGKYLDAGCCQLNGQRNSIEAKADLGDGRRIMVREVKTRLRFGRAFDEEPRRLKFHDYTCGMIGQGQGWHPINRLAIYTKRFAARCNNFELWAGLQKLLSDLCAGFNQMFTIIEDEQKGFVTQIINQDIQQWNPLNLV